MSRPDDNLSAEAFQLGDIDAYGALFADDAPLSAFDETVDTPRLVEDHDTPGLVEDQDTPALIEDRDESTPAAAKPRKGLIGRMQDGIALGRGETSPADEDEHVIVLADENDEPAAPRLNPLERLRQGVKLAQGAPEPDALTLDADADDQPAATISPLDRLKAGLALARGAGSSRLGGRGERALKRDAGLDISAPSGRLRRRQVTEAQISAPDDFAKLLTPLQDPEVMRLQSEAEREDAVIVLLDRARNDGERYGRFGGVVATLSALLLILAVAFRTATDGIANVLLDGVPHYFTDTVEKATLGTARQRLAARAQ